MRSDTDLDQPWLDMLKHIGAVYQTPRMWQAGELALLGQLVGYTSGSVGTDYVNFRIVQESEETLSRAASAMSRLLLHDVRAQEALRGEPVTLCGIPTGGAALLARMKNASMRRISVSRRALDTAMCSGRGADEFYFEKPEQYPARFERVVLVDDVFNTGYTAHKVFELCERHHARIVLVLAFFNRSVCRSADAPCVRRTFSRGAEDVPVVSLIEEPMLVYSPDDLRMPRCVRQALERGNVEWDPKQPEAWARLMAAMRYHDRSIPARF